MSLLDRDQFRQALSRWASGVTVVAAEYGGEVRGMTASSFSSVSLDPPLVMVCVDQRARLLEALEHGERFTINLLADHQEADSNHFAGRPVPDYHPLAPDLSLEGALATLHCRRWQIYPGGDHRIVVGLVETLQLGSEARPLLYWNRGYRRIS